MAKSNLHMAKINKADEFYTQLSDIETEMRHYKKYFKGKTVLCNCDDPFESNFFKYFAMKFNFLGLKKLIATCYSGSPIAGGEIPIFDMKSLGKETKERTKPHKIVITEVKDENKDGAIDLTDVAYLLKNRKNVMTLLEGDGDFRSDECLELLKEADIVVTNPPFSLFREYIKQLVESKKKFIVIGNHNATTYKEIFPLLKDNKMWLGYYAGDMAFTVPEYYEERETRSWIDETGQKWRSMGNICWFTNLDIKKRHDEITLVERYTPTKYTHFDNYDAINVDKVAEIPYDYYEPMGVPITFLDKHNPEQFEILGTSDNGLIDDKYKKTPGLTKKFVDDYYKSGGTGTYKEGNPTAGYYEKNVAKMAYKRIITDILHMPLPTPIFYNNLSLSDTGDRRSPHSRHKAGRIDP